MSDSQGTSNHDAAGWTQVGLAISAFSVALIAFSDADGFTLSCLLTSLICSVFFTYFQAGSYIGGEDFTRSIGVRILLLISLLALTLGVIDWMINKY